MTVLIAALAACGVFLIAWTLAEAFVMPLPNAFVIVYLHGDAAETEQCVRASRWMRDRRRVNGKLIFVDQGLDEEAKEIVRRMISGDTTAAFCTQPQLAEYLKLEKEELGTGAD